MENLFKKNPLQDLLFSLNAVISTNESTEFTTGHVIYNLAYTYKFQLKTTNMMADIICFEVRVTRKMRIITYLFNKFFQNLRIANRLQRRKIDNKKHSLDPT